LFRIGRQTAIQDSDTLSIEQAGGEAKTISPKAIPILRYFSGLNFPEFNKASWLCGRQNLSGIFTHAC
jgi:hypothetical protein